MSIDSLADNASPLSHSGRMCTSVSLGGILGAEGVLSILENGTVSDGAVNYRAVLA